MLYNSKLLVVVGQDSDTLHPEIDWDHFKNMLGVETYCICSEAACVADELHEVKYVVQFPDFEKSYEWTSAAAAVQWGTPPVFLLTPSDTGFSIQYGNRKAVDVPASEVPLRVCGWLQEEATEERLADYAVAFISVLFVLFVILLHSLGAAMACGT